MTGSPITLDTASFSRGLQAWQRRFELSNDKAIRAVAMRLFENIIRRTPVDTGWARANWYPSLNKRIDPPSGNAPAGVSGLPPANPAAVVAQGRAGHVFWLQNGVPYILALENGSSQQAPSGMVQLSIQEAREFFAKYAEGRE